MDRPPHSPVLNELLGEIRMVTAAEPVPPSQFDESKIAIVTAGETVKWVTGDDIARFLTDATVPDQNARVLSGDLYAAFHAWAAQKGYKPWSRWGFSKAMQAAGYQKIVHGGTWWLGLTLRGDVSR